jgi:hypothetical protein
MNPKSPKRALSLCCLIPLMIPAMNDAEAQPAGFNYDESSVPAYTLPDPLVDKDGRSVTTVAGWTEWRRAEVMELFRAHVYGRSPESPARILFGESEADPRALGGKATRREVILQFQEGEGPRVRLLIYLPNEAKGPVPLFVGLNFHGNHTIQPDPGISLPTQWVRNDDGRGVSNNRASEESRGSSASRWPVELIVSRGYGLATVYCGDLEPDFPEGWKMGVRGVFPAPKEGEPAGAGRPQPGGVKEFEPDSWGAIGAWAWGLSRAMDFFVTDEAIDHRRVALLGHSRLGKTALWAGAQDERFAIVISNNSGCGGAALSRRRFGETVRRINTSFPHWFCDRFNEYNDNEDALPVDQHMLIALVAPRPVYIASAQEDSWADPRGEFLSAKHAEPVYRLFGSDGLGVEEMPAVDSPVGGRIGYHIRTGKHDVTTYDWEQYLNFADRHFGRK